MIFYVIRSLVLRQWRMGFIVVIPMGTLIFTMEPIPLAVM